ncbi:hypothetical protein A4R44_04131 [Amycolatopsis sp. M39]|nr:hypothetical protein A4R44_04131 [Amycolatopsis sp. M39]
MAPLSALLRLCSTFAVPDDQPTQHLDADPTAVARHFRHAIGQPFNASTTPRCPSPSTADPPNAVPATATQHSRHRRGSGDALGHTALPHPPRSTPAPRHTALPPPARQWGRARPRSTPAPRHAALPHPASPPSTMTQPPLRRRASPSAAPTGPTASAAARPRERPPEQHPTILALPPSPPRPAPPPPLLAPPPLPTTTAHATTAHRHCPRHHSPHRPNFPRRAVATLPDRPPLPAPAQSNRTVTVSPSPQRTTRPRGPRPFARNRCAARVNPPQRIPAYLPNQPPAGQEQPTAP